MEDEVGMMIAASLVMTNLEERFWEKVDKRGPIPEHRPYLGRCWTWTAGTNNKGYGYIGKGAPSRKMLQAHRLSYELHNGPIAVGEGYHGTCVLHECDNPSCVNPVHLFLGTVQDNMRDRDEKGRQAGRERHGNSKLTEGKASEIRSHYVRGSRTYGMNALARKHGVGSSTIWRIVHGESW